MLIFLHSFNFVQDIDFNDGDEDNKENINEEEKNLELEKVDNNNTDKNQDEEMCPEEADCVSEGDQEAYSKLELELKEEVGCYIF